MNTRVRVARDVMFDVCKNAAMALPLLRQWRLRRPRTAAAFDGSIKQLERYAFNPLRYLLRLHGSIRGLAIAEVGPGDYLTSGLSMLAAGASSYTAIERFVGDFGGSTAKEWYRGIEMNWPEFFPDIPWPDHLRGALFPEDARDRVTLVDAPFERYKPERQFDIVCSFQVGEHLSDISVFAQMHSRILAPNGVAIHRVDFAPHGQWMAYADPLTFLRLPDWLWSMLSSHRGLPNRVRHHEFLAAFKAAGLAITESELEYFDTNRIEQSKLSPRFRTVSMESLRVSSAVYVARWP